MASASATLNASQGATLPSAVTPPLDYPVSFQTAVPEIVLFPVLFCMVMFLLRQKIVAKLVEFKGVSAILHSGDVLLTGVCAWLIATWKVYDASSWSGKVPPPVHVVTIVVGLVSVIFCSKLLVFRAGAAEREQIRDLKAEAKVLEEDRNWLLSTVDRIDEILGEKFERLKVELKKEGAPNASPITIANIQQQIIVIVQTIHSFFHERLHYGESLRLGLYVLDETTKNSLVEAYSYDGKQAKCFSTANVDKLRLLRPEGVQSIIVKTYLGDDSLVIIPDTTAEDANFKFFHIDQEKRIRSVLCYRFIVPAPKEDEVWVIYMDSNRPCFFESSKLAPYRVFLEKAAKRIAFESVTLQLMER